MPSYIIEPMRILYNIYRIIRSFLVAALTAVIGLYVILYIVLSIPSVQKEVKKIGEAELSKLLHTEVRVGKLQISPFNQVVLHDVLIPDQQGDTLLSVKKIGAGMSIYNLVAKRRMVFTYAEIIGLDGRIRRNDKSSPTNMQFIIDALSPKDTTKPPTKFDFKIYNIVLRRSRLSYDVGSEPYVAGRFDPNHIAVSDLRADVAIPRLKNDDFHVQLKRLSLKERCGFELTDITANTKIGERAIEVSDMRIELPNSLIAPEDFKIEYSALKNIGKELTTMPLAFELANSYVTPSDLKGFLPALENFGTRISITLALRGTVRDLEIPVISVATDDKRIMLNMNGDVKGIDDAKNMSFSIPHVEVRADANEILTLSSHFANLSAGVTSTIGNCGNIRVDGSVSGTLERLKFAGDVSTALGAVRLNGVFANSTSSKTQSYKGAVSTGGLNVGKLLSKEQLLGMAAVDVEVDVSRTGNNIEGSGKGEVKYVDLKGYRYSDITADVAIDENRYEGVVNIDDENLRLHANGVYMDVDGRKTLEMQAQVSDVNFALLNLNDKYPEHRLAFTAEASLAADDPFEAVGNIILHDVSYCDAADNGLHLNDFIVSSDKIDDIQTIKITSDILNGEANGSFDWRCISKVLNNMMVQPFPSMFVSYDLNAMERTRVNDFSYVLNLSVPDELNKFFNLPVKILVPITLSGIVDENTQSAELEISAPYLMQNKKLIEKTWAKAAINGYEDNVSLIARTMMPTKKGKIDLNLNMNGVADRLDTDVRWKIDRKEDFSGNVNVSALLSRSDDEQRTLNADIDINPTKLVFNDTAWQMHPAKITVMGRNVKVENFMASCDKQYISIDGEVSDDDLSQLCVDLNDINLDYVFETLAIDNVMFGGRATGRFYATNVYSKLPRLSTPNLHVDGLAYNNATLGDADIVSRWSHEDKAVTIDAKLSQANGGKSTINGKIFPTMDSLYFEFRTQKVNIGFMKPFMSAFTSDVEGEASGFACLYGNFKRIDLYGDIFADRLRMKLDYTNTYYTTSDSIKITPGNISFKNVVLRDPEGHTAKLDGWVRHDFFHDARFNFSVTEAKDFLCYNVTQEISPIWYGTIYGDGSAFVKGEPGSVDIDVNMRTAANSRFTFVLSDEQFATEYTFITFIDSSKKNKEHDVNDSIPDVVRMMANANNKERSMTPATRYRINLMAEVTPLAQMVLVMDPVGGDRIKATGSGNLRMTYSNIDDKLSMHGTYELEKGNYNFTLQDIIVREFSIKENSKIEFDGDPYHAKLDVTAYYALNANLTDLDESFATDKDMNRTNVPVQALMIVTGDIKEPKVDFDLAFPTLTSEAHGKIRSVISTTDMMNRQIIYLLALNRFYTPEYMGATSTRNNELASVASSTISSQLSSILGQLSENWSISPNFRSDKGDFSDIEVELALSSQLLNNRLLFNGNFGYRDNTMNTRNSNFIGDFDIEYLLTKNGNIRLKAYNHFNDQNYYIKSALTTQGLGVVFKHDFDRLFDFLKKTPKPVLSIQPSDTVPSGTLMNPERRKEDEL